MSLTPSANDPNRKKELARKKRDPLSFGVFSHNVKPSDWTPQDRNAKTKKEVKK